MSAQSDLNTKPTLWKRFQKVLASVAAGSLVAGVLVAVGVGAQDAHANTFFPEVGIEAEDLLAGEDLPVTLTFSNSGGGQQYNLSAGVVVDANVLLVDGGTFGDPTEFVGLASPQTVVPGTYRDISVGSNPLANTQYCEAHGLVAGNGANLGSCVVPAGKKLLVWENISDLPEGADISFDVVLRPAASTAPTGSPSMNLFGVGSKVDIDVFAYTSDAPRTLPVFPGSTGVATNLDATSEIGTGEDAIDVKAIRLEKVEPSAENELLRGVHNHVTTYTLRVYHTSEGDVSEVTLVDYLPAGLEYLGADLDDHSAAGATEYAEAPRLNPAPLADAGGAWTTETSIDTVEESFGEGEEPGRVYTRVEWFLDALKASQGSNSAGDTRDNTTDFTAAKKQDLSSGIGTPGIPGVMELKYRAGIPLFENTLDFEGITPSPESREQGANLDNNNGPSTRHGHASDVNFAGAKGLTNHAAVSGYYGAAEVSDDTTYTVDAVDVRILKEVDDSGFAQGDTARFTLDIATSEYVTAEQRGTAPNHLTDVLGDGICPVFPTGTNTTAGGPVLTINGAESENAAAWNTVVGPDCAYPSPKGDALTGADLVSIDFSTVTGQYTVKFLLSTESQETLKARPSQRVFVEYSVAQNEAYRSEGQHGATSSGDSVQNDVELLFTTFPRTETATMPVGGEFYASDDSRETLTTRLTTLTKKVLERDAVPADRTLLSQSPANGGPDPNAWVDVASQPFSVGDTVWYRIIVNPPNGSDPRNPILTDVLPAGTSFDDTTINVGTAENPVERYESIYVVPRPANAGDPLPSFGTCSFGAETQIDQWLDRFVPIDEIDLSEDGLITAELGAPANQCGLTGTDRFLPFGAQLEVYIKVTVTDAASFGQVDLKQNLAKYRQNNVDLEVLPLRDNADMVLDTGVRLVKGIHKINGAPAAGNTFNSDEDHKEVVQGDDVEFRIDVTAPSNETTGYVIYDALPEGIRAADVTTATGTNGPRATLRNGTDAADTVSTNNFVLNIYDWIDSTVKWQGLDTAISNNINAEYEGRSIAVWQLNADVAGSTLGQTPVERGFSLFYTVTIPDGSKADGGDEALLSQQYLNTASVAQYDVKNNGASNATTTLVPVPSSVGSTLQPVQVGGDGAPMPSVSKGNHTTDQYAVPADFATDPSDVFLPEVTLEKTLVSSQIDAAADNNAANQIVQGEFVTFDYTVTIPANTSVKGGRLVDLANWKQFTTQTGDTNGGSDVPFFFESVEYFSNQVGNPPGPLACGTAPTQFSCEDTFSDPAGFGALLFPEVYQNSHNVDEQFTARITMWIEQDLTHNRWLENTARFDYINPNDDGRSSMENSERVQYIEPNPSLAKAVTGVADREGDPVPFDAEDPIVPESGEVTYTLTVGNANSRPALFDGVIYDCVPDGLVVDETSFVSGNGTATVIAGEACELDVDGDVVLDPDGTPKDSGNGTVIKWELEHPVLAGVANNATLSYTVTVAPDAGGGQVLPNGAHLRGYTIPANIDGTNTVTEPANERRDHRDSQAREDVRLASAGLTKTVSPEQAPVGETVTYTLTTTLPANANYYDVELWDELPVGLEYVVGQTPTVTFSDSWPTTGPASAPVITGPTVTVHSDSQRLAWTIDPQDIGTFDEERTITITFDAKITAHENLAASPRNTAYLAWNYVDGDNDTRHNVPATADVTILNPELMITKKIDGEDSIERNPDASFLYTLVVEQTANGATPAHNITVQDVVPAGVKVDTTQAALTDATFSNASDLAEGLGGTITWVLDGPLNPRGATADTSIELSYTATFVDSEELSAQSSSYPEGYPYLNVADVTRYESFDDDGWVYEPGTTGNKSSKNPGGGPDIPRITDDADVTPLFPHVVPVKTVTSPVSGESYGIAVADQPFNWTLTIENRGEGIAQDISVTDTLPLNWSYDPGSAKINGVDLDDPQVVVDQTATEGQKITWTVEQLAPGTGGASVTPLAADGSFVITFDAIPSVAALDTPGTGIDVIAHVHRNSVSVTATDTQNNPENGDGDYVGDDDTADAYIAEANLLLEKITIGGVVDTGDTASNLYGLATGTWVPGQGVKNDAPTYAQPQWQITVTNQGPDADFGPFAIVDTETKPAGVVTGEWSAQYYPAGGGTPTPLTITGEGTVTNPFMVGDSTISLNSAGTDRIVLVADVTIPGNVTATGDDLSNMADVRGTVYEDPENFDDNDDETEKPLITVADLSIQKQFAETSDLNAGDSVSWTLTVTNNGPSDSVSSTAEPITVTDAVPAEIENVEMLDLTALPAGWEVDITGNDIELTLTPEAVFPASGAGSTVDFVFTGDIKASVDAGTSITNEAEVHPGETPDPNPGNNEDEDEIEPITANTSVGANKYRVAFDEGSGTWLPLVEGTDATAGTEISYRIGITNTGKADARGVNLVDDLPAELDFVSWAAGSPTTGWVVDETADPLVFTHPDNLAPGAEAWVVVTVEVNESVTGPITNTVCIDDATGNWTEDTDDCASDTSNTDKLVDWELVKSHTVPAVDTPVYAGDTVRYLLQVHNHGPSASAGPITVTDVLPAGFSYADGAVVTGGTVEETIVEATTGDRTQVTWTINGPFATGTDVVTIAYDARAAEDIAPGTYVNNARVDGVEDGTEPGDDPGNNDDDDEVNVLRDATMRINKTVLNADDEWVDTAAYAAGTRATWQIEVINEGPSAVPVTFTDVLPSGLTMVTMEGTGWDCVVADLECEFTDNGGLHPVGSTFITLTSDIAASVQPTPAGESGLRNIGSIAWTDNTPDGDPDMDEDDAFITIYREADLGIVKTALDAEGAETARATAGASLWYSLVVRNEGPSDAVGPIVVHDTLPADVTFAGLTPESALVWEATVDRTGSREVVTFEPRETAPSPGIVVNGEAVEIRYEVELAATLSQDAVLVNDAVIDEDTLDENGDPTTDPDEAPDADTSTVTVDRLIDLGIVKSHDAEQVRIGDVLPFTLEVTNYGPSEASGIVVTDEVPAGLEVVSEVGPVLDEQGDPTGWTIDSIALAEPGDDTADPVIPANPAGGATVVASYASSLAPNETAAPLVIETLVTAAAYQTVTNVATVTGTEPEPDPDPNPNESEDPVIVPPMVELVIVKTAVSEFQVGKVGQYEITVTNNGPTEDPGPFTVVDHLPKGLSFNAASHGGAATAGDTVTWVIEEPLAVGASFTVTLDVNVHQAAYDQPNHEITNVVTVESPAEKTPESVLEDDETVTVKPADPLVVSGSDLAGGLLAAVALMLVLGAAAYATGRRGRGAHAA